LEKAYARPVDALLRRKNKRRLIVDLDSTEDPAHGKQEKAIYHGRRGQVHLGHVVPLDRQYKAVFG